MNEAVKMHAIINSNHDTFICLPSLLQAQFRDTMSTAADGGEDFRIKTILSRTDDLVGWKHEEASADFACSLSAVARPRKPGVGPYGPAGEGGQQSGGEYPPRLEL